MLDKFQRSQVGDYIKFIQRNANQCNSHNNGYGEVIIRPSEWANESTHTFPGYGY
jgi:hypothetical protein